MSARLPAALEHDLPRYWARMPKYQRRFSSACGENPYHKSWHIRMTLSPYRTRIQKAKTLTSFPSIEYRGY
eukprot:717534-Pelagomonas_calceolata.AAC.1